MTIATEAWFRGPWRLARIVADPAGRVTGSFAGTCRFTADGEGLACHEDGTLRHAGGRYPAGRTTLWRFPGAGRIEVLFADGRPFHGFSVKDPAAVHLCGPDRYAVSYAFHDRCWLSRWLVRGPEKDYMMTTRYRRP